MTAKKTRGVIIADVLREAIISGKLEPGKHITEAHIAKQFETSRTPVREAFHYLEAEGLLELRKNKGALVTAITPDDIRNYYELHGLLASYAAAKAATRVPIATIEKMESLAKELRISTEQKDYSAMINIHNAFLELFLSVCENERLSTTLCNLMKPFQRFRVMLSEAKSHPNAVDFYEDIISAFRERDPRRASFLAAKYSGDTSVAILRSINEAQGQNCKQPHNE